jgi:flavodoxin
MKVLIVYDSNFGNTKIVADTIADVMHTKAVSVSDITNNYLRDIELLLVGSPINGWKPTQRITNWLHSVTKDQLKKVDAAGFDTRVTMFFHGDAAGKITKMLKNAGANIIADPKGFFVEGKEGPLLKGEIEKAKEWAKMLLSQSESQKRILSA